MQVNIDAENGYLGIILKKGDLIKESILNDKHFYSTGNQALFRTFKELDEKGEHIDIVSVLTTMSKNDLTELGGRPHLAQLVNSVPSLEPFKTYEKYVINSWKIRTAKMIKSTDVKSIEDISSMLHQLQSIDSQSVGEEYNHKEAVIELYQDFENKSQLEGLTGIDTGFRDLNGFLDGFQSGDLIVSAARPSMGKTAKALNHAIKACEKDNAVVAFFSLEMEKKQLLTRMISTIGRIDGAKLRNPFKRFNEEDWSRFPVSQGILSNMNMYIYDEPGQTVQNIRARVSKLRGKYPDEKILVIIDYLQLIRSDKRYENKNIEVGEITRSLKEIAKEYKLPVYLLSQLSRSVEQRQDKRPIMSDLRDSGNIEQDADVIEFLHREDYYDAETDKKNILDVIIAKQRNGAVGTVEIVYQRDCNIMLDLEYRT